MASDKPVNPVKKFRDWVEAKPPQPFCQLDPQLPLKPIVCGGELDENGVCKICGRRSDGTAP